MLQIRVPSVSKTFTCLFKCPCALINYVWTAFVGYIIVAIHPPWDGATQLYFHDNNDYEMDDDDMENEDDTGWPC
jgi:hypothetical protein